MILFRVNYIGDIAPNYCESNGKKVGLNGNRNYIGFWVWASGVLGFRVHGTEQAVRSHSVAATSGHYPSDIQDASQKRATKARQALLITMRWPRCLRVFSSLSKVCQYTSMPALADLKSPDSMPRFLRSSACRSAGCARKP